VGFIVDFHQLLDGDLSVLPPGAEAFVARPFLHSAQVQELAKEMYDARA